MSTKQPPLPRVKLPAQVRERCHRQAMALARSHADMMISVLEKQALAELHDAIRRGEVAP
jgi:hypothetical protein